VFGIGYLQGSLHTGNTGTNYKDIRLDSASAYSSSLSHSRTSWPISAPILYYFPATVQRSLSTLFACRICQIHSKVSVAHNKTEHYHYTEHTVSSFALSKPIIA
jgi:hypothetical protein